MDETLREALSSTSVIVPALNEELNIGRTVRQLLEHFGRVIVVDDGSSDRTGEVAKLEGALVLRHPINIGQGGAIQTGIAYALAFPHAKYLVTFDSDGQHRVEDAVELLRILSSSLVDVVLGSRFLAGPCEHIPRGRRILLRSAVRYLNWRSKTTFTDAHNGLRAFTRGVAETIDLAHSGMGHATEIVDAFLRHKFRITEAPVKILYTEHSMRKGQSWTNGINILFDSLWRP